MHVYSYGVNRKFKMNEQILQNTATFQYTSSNDKPKIQLVNLTVHDGNGNFNYSLLYTATTK